MAKKKKKSKARGPQKGTPKSLYIAERKARLKYKRAAETTEPGEGKRFEAIAEGAAKRYGSKERGEAVAASIMWKKYGKKGGAALIKKGKQKKKASKRKKK